jgi:phosphoribosyl-ATP pyrophosphohydrolase
MSNDVVSKLAAIISARRAIAADTSYTRQLLDGGPQRCAKKFGEEAVEAVIAASAQSTDELTAEAADVVYHLLVLLESRNVPWSAVVARLEGRMSTSGLAEKASRQDGTPTLKSSP